MKRKLSILSLILVLCLLAVSSPQLAFAQEFVSGGNSVIVDKEPVADIYLVMMAIFAVLDIALLVFVILKIVELVKLKKLNSAINITLALIPYSIATLLPEMTVKVILVCEIVVLAGLFFAVQILIRKIKNIKKEKN